MAPTTPTRIDPTPFLTADREAIAAALPSPLAPLADEIVRSRAILALPDDFDGEGSPGYASPTWLRAVGFLLTNAVQLWQDRGIAVAPPDLGPGSYGTVALHWRIPGHELLLTIPVDPNEPHAFYGHDGSFEHAVKGALDPDADNSWLLSWLMTT